MASKTTEKKIAYHMYVEQGKDAKEVAAHPAVNVSENTLSKWVIDRGWKAEREARVNSVSQRVEDIKRVISNITERRLEIDRERREAVRSGDKEIVAALDVEAVGVADQIAKWNKALTAMSEDSKISLTVYLSVMDDVFGALRAHNNKLFLDTIEFQEQHVHFISQKLG